MNTFWEKFFFVFTYLMQGSSFLSPRAYAILHRMHHAYSDTEKDPHSPHYSNNAFTMMWKTKNIYNDVLRYRTDAGNRFEGDYPVWNFMEKIGDSWFSRAGWAFIYITIYVLFVPADMWYLYLLLPFHFLMGPLHGAIVNWSGHKYGYQNFDNNDRSKNSLFFDFLTGGELFQNNHHKLPNRVNFGVKWFEIDPTYPVIWTLDKLRIIRLKPARA
jgi:stearoyl-CoA desaturase (Delta-9 desaturase)